MDLCVSYDRNFQRMPLTRGEWFNILTARVVNVNNTPILALDSHDGVVAAKHTIRGLVDGIGQLSRMLF